MESLKISISKIINESINTKKLFLQDTNLIAAISDSIECISDSFKKGNKLFLCGNGGSAADAQHIAAEFSGRFYLDREGLFAEALHVNSSYMTAVANDYSYEETYSRLIKAKGSSGDILICISTSGNSENVVRAALQARELGIIVISLTGSADSQLSENSNICVKVPSQDTPRIQEVHIMVGHIICEEVEKCLFIN